MGWAGSTINLCRLRVVPPVEIVEPSLHWPDEFTAIAHKLRTCLGPVALRIDHIGSTSVPGLPAKDVIDVQVTVDTLDLDVLAPGFSQADYGHRSDIRLYDHRPPGFEGPDEDWAKLLFTPLPDQRTAHVHVRLAGRPNQRYALLFRDYLRTHPAAAAAYAELKRRLANLGIDRHTYAHTKDPACDLIMVAAEEWALQIGWQPGPDAA
jgi:GrpB-like predicted nucleotidyltransferase (UPF0157 family)